MSPALDTRLARLQAELDDHSRIGRYLGLDLERPIRSLGDGYPENAVALVGNITERLLKQLWRHHDVPGTPAGKALTDLIRECRPYIRSRAVIDALHDIRRLRNRSSHDGYPVADEDALTAVRRLLDVLAWYTSTGSGALTGDAPRLSPAVAAKAEFLAGLYVTLDYQPAKRFELSQHTVYQLFVRERGIRTEYAELLLSRDAGDVAQVLQATGGQLLEQAAADGGNLLIVGPPGAGKTTLLKQLVIAAPRTGARRYRFYFDLSLKGRDEPLAEFLTRCLGPYMVVDAAYVFPVWCYFARAGSVLCALDGFDEAVPEHSQAGFLDLFGELAELLSAESAVVTTSRVSFLEDSPEVRRLMDGTSLMSEKLVQQLHAQGVDPLRVPRFSVLRLTTAPGAGSLLATQLAADLAASGQAPAATGNTGLAELLWEHITQVAGPALLPVMTELFGPAFLRGVTTFTLADLAGLGSAAFDAGRVSLADFRLAGLFRAASPLSAADSQAAVAFRHAAYQELLAAEYLRAAARRNSVLAAIPRPRITEQVREFLHHRAAASDDGPGDCIVPVDTYLVGPSHHLMLRRLERDVRLDQFPVTVARYKQFLAAIERHGSSSWDHPDMPAGQSHRPWRERLRVPGYYDDPAYDNYPAIAISWWSARAFAAWDGGRLPTSLEWEAAARGPDGRLFPWGDQIDLDAVNCADTWAGRPLITYEAWRAELDTGRLRDALPGPVDAHPANVSPFGIREMSGNVWELTSTVLPNVNEAVICGGSFDNPYRAVQASSKGSYRRRGCSNAVGFRCARDLP
jgi:energy-coupling factor transporter ATP-binding protein EcfA2